jgi:protein disulfide-isomerase A1
MIFKLLLISIALFSYKFDESFGLDAEENVVVFKTTNFDEFISKHDLVMVEFYAPWCGHCKSLAPKYAELAKIMKDEHNIPIGKVDSTVETELAKKYGIQGYPTLKLFVKGSPVDYKGAREVNDMKEYILKKSGPATVEIKTLEELEKLKQDNKVLVVYFGTDGSEELKQYQAAALTFDNVKLVHVFDTELMTKAEASVNKVILYKQFDEKMNIFEGKYDATELAAFVEDNRFPNVMDFDQEAAEKIFGKEESAIFLFDDSTESNELKTTFSQLAKENKGAINYSISTVTTGLGQRLAEFVGVSAAESPCVRIVQFANQALSKFKYAGDLKDKDALLAFINDFKAGKLEKYYKSEKAPENNDGPVKVVVGENFKEIVLDESKHVLIEAYAPWCGHCKQLAPIYDELGEKMKGRDDIVIAKMDATGNEYPGFDIQGFPTIRFYKKGDKSKPMDFDGERTLDGFVKFLEKNADYKSEEAQETEL